MEDKTKKKIKIALCGVAALSIAAIGYTYVTNKKMNQLIDFMNQTTGNLSNDLDVVVSDYVVNQAVEKAVNREVNNSITKATKKAVEHIDSDIYSKVSNAINDNYLKVKDSVAKELSKQISHIDISEIKNEVAEAAKEEAVNKFNEELEDVLRKFNNNLESVSKIYQSIADSMSSNNNAAANNKELTFKLM